MSVTLHPERVKAEIRMRHGTLRRFAEEVGLNEEQVRDYLRGRSSTAHEAIARLLGVKADRLVLSREVPKRGRNSAIVSRAHRLSGEAA